MLRYCITLITLTTLGCATTPKGAFLPQNVPAAPDYAEAASWAALPTRADNADRVPTDTLEDRQATAAVDVFFLHPTTYTQRRGNTGWNGPVDDADLNERTDESTILHQASIFNAVGRIYAPRYRQAHLAAYYPETGQAKDAEAAFELAYRDVKAAFRHYVDHYSEGRPFIIASHSQGTTHAKRLIRDLIDGTPLQDRLVAAYLVGIVVYPADFPTLKTCATPTATGCYVNWRTYREDYAIPPRLADTTTVVATNPLTWTTEATLAPATLNQGAVLRKFDGGLHPGLVHARVAAGVVLTNKPRFPWSFLLTTKNYHIADYNFFWMNVRQNAADRVAAFLQP